MDQTEAKKGLNPGSFITINYHPSALPTSQDGCADKLGMNKNYVLSLKKERQKNVKYFI